MKPRRVLSWIVAAVTGLGFSHASETVALNGRAMGTGWSVKFVQPASPLDPEVVERQVADRLEQLEQIFSTFRAESELSHFNAAADTGWTPVSPAMAHVAGESRAISELTGGAFDATVFPLVQLWGFASQRRAGSVPSNAEIAAARSRVDWRQLEARENPPALRKSRAGVSADFSSMAKGFASDAVSDLLTQLGAPNHLVQIGGDMKSGAADGEGAGWQAAIEQPIEDSRGIACVLVLNGQALSTSGDYRNFFRVGRQRYGHIIDPRTGEPPSSSLASVSVVHASCAWSSSLATALFVLGPDEGFRLATRRGLACLFLLRRGTALIRLATPEFERLLARQDRS